MVIVKVPREPELLNPWKAAWDGLIWKAMISKVKAIERELNRNPRSFKAGRSQPYTDQIYSPSQGELLKKALSAASSSFHALIPTVPIVPKSLFPTQEKCQLTQLVTIVPTVTIVTFSIQERSQLTQLVTIVPTVTIVTFSIQERSQLTQLVPTVPTVPTVTFSIQERSQLTQLVPTVPTVSTVSIAPTVSTVPFVPFVLSHQLMALPLSSLFSSQAFLLHSNWDRNGLKRYGTMYTNLDIVKSTLSLRIVYAGREPCYAPPCPSFQPRTDD